MNLIEYKKNIKYRVRKLNRKVYIFGEGNSYEINEIGLKIWEYIGKNIYLEDIVKEITEEFNEDIVIIREDVRNYLNELMDFDIILFANDKVDI